MEYKYIGQKGSINTSQAVTRTKCQGHDQSHRTGKGKVTVFKGKINFVLIIELNDHLFKST